MDHAELDETTRKAVDRLKALRQASDDVAPDEVRQRLVESLQEMLAGLPKEQAAQRIDRIRDALVREAQQRHERLELLENTARKLQSENDALRGERDRLTQQLAQRPGAGRPEAKGGSDHGLERMRQALIRLSEEGSLTGATMSLAPADLHLLQVVELLYQFALAVTTAARKFIAESGGAGVTMMGDLSTEAKKRFKACLENRPDALKELAELLSRGGGFLQAVDKAYKASIRTGVKDILEQMDPQPISERHKRMAGLGVNYEDAWKTLSNAHNDLSNQTPLELWDQFFRDTFHTELSRLADGGPAKR